MLTRSHLVIGVFSALALTGLATTSSAAAPPAFGVPVGLAGGTGGEPSIGTDGQGNVLVGGPQGVPGGQGAYWLSTNHGASYGPPAVYGGASGGGDEDIAFNPHDGTQYADRIYITDLAASHSTVCVSTDHGVTFNAIGPAPDALHCHGTAQGQTTPSSDRQWLTADTNGRAYITDHEFVSALPRAWTTTNGGTDAFAQPCGAIVSDPNILVNVPTDITGGTLVSKPVVDAAGNLYVLFTTTTQTQNVTGVVGGKVSGTFSQAYMAVSKDHCTTFTDYTIFDGNSAHAANTVQFGDIFNTLAIDPAGNLYAIAAGFIGDTAFAKTADLYMFTSTNHGVTWSPPRTLTTDVGSHVLPAATVGTQSGQLAVGYFRTTNGKRDPNDATDRWTYTIGISQNALDPNIPFVTTDVAAAPGAVDNTYHYGDICTSGTLCGLPVPGAGTDRSLLDFTSATTDSDGCTIFTFAGNPKSASNGTTMATLNYVTKQTAGCFVTPASNQPEVPLVPGLLIVGLGAVGAVAWRRRRHPEAAPS